METRTQKRKVRINVKWENQNQKFGAKTNV